MSEQNANDTGRWGDETQEENGLLKLMKRRDVQIILGILVIAALLFVLIPKPAAGATSATVVIYVGNQEYKRVPLNELQDILVEQTGGRVNEIVIDGHGVHMGRSTCDNQDCVQQGEITLDNYEERVLSTWIVCLPNEVSIELVVDE